MTDLMQRLRAADPVHEEPIPPPVEPLLARLEALPPAAPPRRRWRPAGAGASRTRQTPRGAAPFAARLRRPLVPVIVALLAVAVVAGLAQRSSPDVVAEARAALGTSEEIIHVVTRTERSGLAVKGSGDQIWVDDHGRPLGRFSNRTERWAAIDPLRERSRFTIVPERGGTPHTIDFTYADGVTQIKQSWTDKVQSDPVSGAEYAEQRGRINPAEPGPDPVAGIRELLASGDLKAAGETTLEGRRVLRLVAQEPQRNTTPKGDSPATRIEYLVDASTYVPVRITQDDRVEIAGSEDDRDGSRRSFLRRVTTFETFERLPLTPENEALLRLP